MTATTFEHNGSSYELPDIKTVKPGVMRKARKGENEMDKTFLLLELLLGDDSPTMLALDDLTPEDFNKVIGDWLQGAQLGE
jgi:hypothetical protein